MKAGEVRTRFAPSPTGFFHIGSARTALFNYLFTKKNKGSFVLRIEDTDLERSKPEFEKDIIDSLKWLGIEWTEGPDIGGNYGPYRQSERIKIYEKYLEQLLDEKLAYYCFCTPEELEAKRQDQMSRGVAPKYDGKCSSLSLSQVKKNLEEKKKFVIRLKVPAKKIIFNDVIRGKVEFDTKLIGDFVIAKSFQAPTPFQQCALRGNNEVGTRKVWGQAPLFYLAGVIDDQEMKISHVIRGEEHISNTPKQILIQEALNFSQPIYGHLPLILAPDRSKLSKRHGAVSVAEYKKDGYLPETLINFMALLGWNPGDEKEIFSLNNLVKTFSLDGVQKAGAVFNIKRLDYLNGFYIRQKSVEKITLLCLPYLIEKGFIAPIFEAKIKNHYKKEVLVQNYEILETKEKISLEELEKIIASYQQRLKKLSEITEFTDFFFKNKLDYPQDLLVWQDMTDQDLLIALEGLEEILANIKEGSWNLKSLENILLLEAERLFPGKNKGYLLWPLRVALTGKKASAGPFEIAEILGKEKTLARIKQAKEMIKGN